MKRTSLSQYFYSGFSLANQSFDFLFIAILLQTPFLVVNYVKNDTILGNSILLIAIIIILLIDFGYILSIPLLLVHKQQREIVSYREVLNIMIRNTKRIILPFIICFFIFTALFIMALGILINTQIVNSQSFSTSGEGWHAIFFVPILVLSFFTFTSFFFSLEQNGLFTSMKKSIAASFKNLRYIALVMLFGVVSYSIISFIPMGSWRQLSGIVLGQYADFVVVASSLFYYQEVIKVQDVIKEGGFVKTSRGRTVNRRP